MELLLVFLGIFFEGNIYESLNPEEEPAATTLEGRDLDVFKRLQKWQNVQT